MVVLPFVCVCSGQLNKVSVYVEKLLLSPWLLQNLSVSKRTCPVQATGNHMDFTGIKSPAALGQPLLLKPRHEQFRPPQFWVVVCSLLWWHFKTWFGNTGCVFCNGQPFYLFYIGVYDCAFQLCHLQLSAFKRKYKIKPTDYNVINL